MTCLRDTWRHHKFGRLELLSETIFGHSIHIRNDHILLVIRCYLSQLHGQLGRRISQNGRLLNALVPALKRIAHYDRLGRLNGG